MAKEKDGLQERSNQDLHYYDMLASLFERIVWITLLWAFIINTVSETSQDTKNYTYLLLFITALFNTLYFRYFYPFLRQSEKRFYLTSLVFPLLIWVFIHLHSEFLSYFLLPYYVLLLSTSLTLRRKDVSIALISSLFFLILETAILRLPMDSQEQTIAIGQVSSLLVFTWVSLKLSDLIKRQRDEAGTILQEIQNEEKKSSILKEYTSELMVDRQKARVLLDSYPDPLLLLDNKYKIVEVNDEFKKLSDFKDERLVGKELNYVLKLEQPLNTDQKSFLPLEFQGKILTRRNKVKNVVGRAHFLLGRDQRLKQVLLLLAKP